MLSEQVIKQIAHDYAHLTDEEFARAIEAEVRKQDTELIRQMLEALKTCIQACDYLSEIESVATAQDAARARLENTP